MLDNFKKSLRRKQTDAEAMLWYFLRNRNLSGFKFRRQHVLGMYIVDFICLEKNLIIELDGGQHADQVKYDNISTKKLEKAGFHVLRFWNDDVLQNIEGVWKVIDNILNTPHPALRADLSLKGLLLPTNIVAIY